MKKDCGFYEVFNIFDEIDNNCNKLDGYNPRTLNKINTKSWNPAVSKNYGI